MNYNLITIGACLDLYISEGTRVILENGQITGFEENSP